ncbi:MAG: DUF4404 family protein [Fibrobacterota bacterium]|jgi:hypothetical protein
MEEIRKKLREVQKKAKEADVKEASELLEKINPVVDHPENLSFQKHRSIAETVKNAAEKFEYRHPDLIAEIRTVINYLNDAGI